MWVLALQHGLKKLIPNEGGSFGIVGNAKANDDPPLPNFALKILRTIAAVGCCRASASQR